MAPKLRAASINDWSAVCTPSLQLSMSGITAERKTRVTFVCAPKPSHRMSSGASAIRGIAKNPHRYGEVSRSVVGDIPMRRPRGMPTTNDSTRPIIIALMLSVTAGHMVPSVTASTKASQTAPGPGRRTGLGSKTQIADCQMRRNATKLRTPGTRALSCCCHAGRRLGRLRATGAR